MVEILRLAQRVIDLAGGDLNKGNLITDSPLAVAMVFRGLASGCLGVPAWKDDIRQGFKLSRSFEATTLAGAIWFGCVVTIPNGMRSGRHR
jgi:adenylate cyclase